MSNSVQYIQDKGIESIVLLLVEDQPALCEMVNNALKRLGFHHIVIARDGVKGLEALESRRIDIVLTDWTMDRMDGVTMTRLIRVSKNPANRMVPIVMMSGRTTPEDVREARDAGITEFVSKPFDIKQLCDRLIAIVEKPRDFVLAPNFNGPDRRRTGGKEVDTNRRRAPTLA